MCADLDKDLENLSIDNVSLGTVKEFLTGKKNVSSYQVNEIKKFLLSNTRRLDVTEEVYGILKNERDVMLENIRMLGDPAQSLVVELVELHTPPEERKGQVLELLTSIGRILKKENEISGKVFYLGLYYRLMFAFDVSKRNQVSLVLELVCPDKKDFYDDTYEELCGLVTLVVIQNIRLDSLSEKEVADYLDILCEEDPADFSGVEFLKLIKTLELMFPVIPISVGTFYSSQNCKNAVLYQISKLAAKNFNDPLSKVTAIELLKLINSSNMDQATADFNASNYLGVLVLAYSTKGTDFSEINLLALVCIIKIWRHIEKKVDKKEVNLLDLLNSLKTSLDAHNGLLLKYGVEGFAYLTLNASINEIIRDDTFIVKKLVSILSSQYAEGNRSKSCTTISYGLLCTLLNLMKLNDGTSAETKTVNYLRDFASPGVNAHANVENEQKVRAFNKSLLFDYKLISIVSQILASLNHSASTKSKNVYNSLIGVVFMISLVPEKAVKVEMVKQGALNVLLDYLLKYSTSRENSTTVRPSSESDEDMKYRFYSLRALASILIYIDPNIALKKYDAKVCIPFLVELLGPDISQYSGQISEEEKYLYDRTNNMTKYESLLALTNMASIESHDMRNFITIKVFDKYLDNLIIDTSSGRLQKAAWELVNNLIIEPSMLAKFFNLEKQENSKRLFLLVSLLNSDDESLQKTIAGLLANATSEFIMVSQILLQHDVILNKIKNTMARIFERQVNDVTLMLPLLYFLLNLTYVADEAGSEYLKKLSEDKEFQKHLKSALSAITDEETSEVLREIFGQLNK